MSIQIKSIMTGIAVLITSVMAGLLLGLVIGKLVTPPSGMGWDKLADALGSAMLGAGLGVAAGILAILRLGLRGQCIWAVIAMLLGMASFAAAVLTA